MSFILDALKKSEERRRLEEGERTSRQRILDLTWSGSQRWPVWVFLAVLLVALACGWWLRGVSLDPATVVQPLASTTTVPPGEVTPSAPPPHAVASENHGARATAREVGPAPFAPVPAAPVEVAGQPATGRPSPVAGKVAGPGVGVPVKSAGPATPAARQRQVPGQVPASLRERVSRLTMSMHFYAEDPAQRMVRIDNRILREGQALAADLMLEEITPRGVIFASAGVRFEVPRPGGQP